MALIHLRRSPALLPRNARINESHPLAIGLRRAFTFQGAIVDAVTGTVFNSSATFGAYSFTSSERGPVINLPNGGGVTVGINEDWQGPSTTVAVCRIAAIDSPWGVLWRKNGSSAQQLQVGRNDTTDDYYFYRSGGAGLRQVTASSIAGDLGKWVSIGVTNAAQAIIATWEMYSAGTQLGTGSYSGDQQATGSGDLYLGGGTSTDGAGTDSTVEFLYFLHWSRVLTANELGAVHLNPKQLFESERRYIPIAPAGSIVTPTLTAASAINVTSTTARARVTFTRP